MYKQDVSLLEYDPARLFLSVLTLTFAEITLRLSSARDKTKLCCGDCWQLAVFFQTMKKTTTFKNEKLRHEERCLFCLTKHLHYLLFCISYSKGLLKYFRHGLPQVKQGASCQFLSRGLAKKENPSKCLHQEQTQQTPSFEAAFSEEQISTNTPENW